MVDVASCTFTVPLLGSSVGTNKSTCCCATEATRWNSGAAAPLKVSCTPCALLEGNIPDNWSVVVPRPLAKAVTMQPGDAVPGLANDALFTTEERPANATVTAVEELTPPMPTTSGTVPDRKSVV